MKATLRKPAMRAFKAADGLRDYPSLEDPALPRMLGHLKFQEVPDVPITLFWCRHEVQDGKTTLTGVDGTISYQTSTDVSSPNFFRQAVVWGLTTRQRYDPESGIRERLISECYSRLRKADIAIVEPTGPSSEIIRQLFVDMGLAKKAPQGLLRLLIRHGVRTK